MRTFGAGLFLFTLGYVCEHDVLVNRVLILLLFFSFTRAKSSMVSRCLPS